ncbi:hypothetical protein [Vibrio splendidus]|uniref:hypothetical protein n=1 Tax=Vibrio splendidus TaxID=29497 RepID=UPI002468A7A4|nr:hypothetical protein [Vibrio splendidus]MDH5887564.1 hypothetical protein [Vibrio splendidus]
MKKALIGVAVVAAISGTAFATNSYLVNEATGIIQGKAPSLLSSIEKELLDVQLIESEIIDNKVKQSYAIYFVLDGERSNQALYIEHIAQVGPFAMNTNGSFSLLKDRGLTKLFIDDIASINEVVNYTYTANDGMFDVDATLDIGSVKKNREKIVPGQVNVKYIGNGENNDLSVRLSSLKFDNHRESMIIDKAAIKIIDNVTTQTSSLDFSLDKFRLGEKNNRDNFIDLSGISLVGQVTGDDFVELATGISIDNASINANALSYNDAKISFKSNFDNINAAVLEEMIDVFSSDQSYKADKKIQNLWKQFYASGVNVKNIELQVNNSKAVGDIKINEADYSAVRSNRLFKAVISNLETDLAIELEKPLVKALGMDNNPKKFNQYFYDTGEHYSTKLKIVNGEGTANGQRL